MATIKDVAERSGVAVSTVSRVLNNRGSISDKLRKRVYAAMKELNYEPNELARSLQRQRSHLIAVIASGIDHPFFSRVLQAVEHALAEAGYRMMVFSSRGSIERENALLPLIRSAHADGILLCGYGVGESVYSACSIPIVTIDRQLRDDIPSVSCDSFQGGRLAADALYRGGGRHPLVLHGGSDTDFTREAGFTQRCSELGITPLTHIYTAAIASDPQKKYREFFTRLLQDHPEIDGVFTLSDLSAVGICIALRQLGYRIPEDIQIIGFDGVMIGDFLDITTIAQPAEAIGEFAADMLLKTMRGKLIPRRSLLPVSLLERGTTRHNSTDSSESAT